MADILMDVTIFISRFLTENDKSLDKCTITEIHKIINEFQRKEKNE